MAQNHLIVGLGGTGGKVIRAFKKTIFQEFRNDKPEKANMEYLYVDSSSEMMAIDDPSWKILGKSVQLGKHQQLLIQGANLSAQLENINNYPGIKSWVGRKDQWQDILNSIVGEVLGGQKRRLGRFLFAGKIKEFRQQIQNLVRDLQQKGLTAVTFHICCGLAGGTGGGSLIDVISQIREMYADSKTHRIIVYALIPDTHPKPNWDTGNYHANGYAALLELNALSVGAWEPHDLLGNKDRLKLQDPFNGCYLFYNENENGLSVDVSKDVPTIVADFLYQKLIAVSELSWSNLGRMENAENGDGTPECAPGSRKGERSKRFLSFGIKRLAIPEEEIREYMTYNFARQTSLQMLYNNWSDSAGFMDEARSLSFREFVGQKDVQENWLITDEHLSLSKGILPDEILNKKWKPINLDWFELIPNLKEVVRQQDNKKWLDELARLCDKRFNHDYRGLGVRRFYEIKNSARKDHAKEISNRIESDLFGSWLNGSRSIYEISRLLDALVAALEERLKDIGGKAAKSKDNAEAALQKITATNKEWAKVGVLSGVLGKRNNLLDAQGNYLQEHYVYLTRAEAWQFAKGLIQEVISEITSLRNEVARCMSLLAEVTKDFLDSSAQRCADGGHTDLRRPLVQFYDPSSVKEFTKQLIRDKMVQHAQAGNVRQTIADHLGENPDFTAFNSRIPKQRLIDILEAKCEEGAVNAHNNLIAGDKDRTRQLGVSIIEKLYKEYGADEEGLKTYVHELVSRAGNYLIFDSLEVTKVGPGIATSPSKISQFSVILPKAPEWAAFVTSLRAIFRGSLTSHVEIIESDAKPHEIALISITNLFPLRFVKQMQFLKQRYDTRTTGPDSVRAKLELHCEGDGQQYPRLFVASAEEVKREVLPFLLLAKSLGMIQQCESPTTGNCELLLLTKDEDGFDNSPVRLGQSLVESLDKVDAESLEVIRSAVQNALSKDYLHVESRAELKKRLVSAVEEVKALRNADIDDPIYRSFLEAGKGAAKIVAKEG